MAQSRIGDGSPVRGEDLQITVFASGLSFPNGLALLPD